MHKRAVGTWRSQRVWMHTFFLHILFHIGGLDQIPLRFNCLEIPPYDLYGVILPTPCFPAKSGYFKADNFNEFIFLSEL